MSISVSLHSKRNEKFEVEAYITSGVYEKDYVVIKIESRGEDGFEDITVFPSYEQAKQLHKELSKLMRLIKKMEKPEEVKND